jgi:hypothetical protein
VLLMSFVNFWFGMFWGAVGTTLRGLPMTNPNNRLLDIRRCWCVFL